MKNSNLVKFKMDPVPFCIFKEQIQGELIADSAVRNSRLKSKQVAKITGQQLEDGSWDRFHTLSTRSIKKITTENAVKRLLILGLGKDDLPLRRAFSYMEKYLLREIDYRDDKENLSDWREINELFSAAWMLEIDNSSSIANRVADKWAMLITQSFTQQEFNYRDYLAAFKKIFKVDAGKRVWNLECFHVVSIARGRLEPKTENRFIKHILGGDKGLYYLTSCGKLDSIPSEFMSRNAVRFIWSHYFLSRFPSYKKYSEPVCNWLKINRLEDGLWDFGPKSKDDVFLPYSDSWRIHINRKIDSTILVENYLQSVSAY
ncbi:hypothetical protein [Reinekea sp. G2M2-21]|uniref:hypothetical protein n=1 Tax=Reinekea sp. G2M2-21 TaxID=2788942 RepID=UPI0018A9650B|nr:hypothetical protein [Reinekea sp. G2M2-21]